MLLLLLFLERKQPTIKRANFSCSRIRPLLKSEAKFWWLALLLVSRYPLKLVYPNSLPYTGCKADIIFVVDESNAVGQFTFLYVVDFIRRIVASLDIGYHGDQVPFVVLWFLNYIVLLLLQMSVRSRHVTSHTHTHTLVKLFHDGLSHLQIFFLTYKYRSATAWQSYQHQTH